jgi:F420-non-reducing hydrogenase iron-sulfur subunit
VNAKRRTGRAASILAEIGLEPERIQMVNLSSAMASQFVEIVNDAVERIEALGPNPLKFGDS